MTSCVKSTYVSVSHVAHPARARIDRRIADIAYGVAMFVCSGDMRGESESRSWIVTSA